MRSKAIILVLVAFVLYAQPFGVPVTKLVTLNPVRDIFHGTTGQTVYTLSTTPANDPWIFLNGLLLTAPDDYSLAGTTLTIRSVPTVTIVNAPNIGNPIVQALYWTQ